MKAYHILNPGSDAVRLAEGQAAEPLIQKIEALHHTIISSKALRPARANKNKLSRMFELDHLAGDDRYIFLSLGRRYWLSPDEANFGFVFDAEQLIQDGAILRTRDLLSEYEDLLDEVVSQDAPGASVETWSSEEKEKLFAALENPDEHPEYKSSNDEYYELLDAVQQGNLEHPQARQAIEELKARIFELQTANQLTGQAALLATRKEGETGRYEILVAKELPVKFAVGYIKHGQEIPTGRGGKRRGAGRHTKVGTRQTFLIAIRPELFERLKKQEEIKDGRSIEDKTVIERAREKCYDLLESLAAGNEEPQKSIKSAQQNGETLSKKWSLCICDHAIWWHSDKEKHGCLYHINSRGPFCQCEAFEEIKGDGNHA